jgi:endonuclease/exonuclease/phosphatase family metal-dependent hydrolase
MRLISYNILDGGEGRADPIAEVIEAQRPDVVCLVEADDTTVLDRIAKRLSFELIHAPGNTHACALLSRWPIRESINHAPLHKDFEKSLLEATVVEPATNREWTVGVVHLHAHGTEIDEQQREREIDTLLKIFSVHRASGRPHLLAGDFNANAPYQQIDPARTKPRTQKDWAANGGHLPRRAVQKLLAAGYVDTLHAVDPAAAAVRGTFSTQFPGQRVDYVFAHGFDRPRLTRAWIEQDRLAKYASDHFPVGVEVQ